MYLYTEVQVAGIAPATQSTRCVLIPDDLGHKFQPGCQIVVSSSNFLGAVLRVFVAEYH